MNFLITNTKTNVKLLPRSEGKIKSYESCVDVRAWSHDVRLRDRHLREWIKRDMPICVLPVCTLASFLRTMTYRSRGRTAPRCHPDCKSKALIESLCNSCQAINECLKCDPTLDKYFVEEELDTSHWPCDRCLDVLKSVKMFWKIIIEKIFCINLSKREEFQNIHEDMTDSVKSVAKLWEKEIVQQAVFVKGVTPILKKELTGNGTSKQTHNKKEVPSRIPKPCKTEIKDRSFSTKRPALSVVSQRSRSTETGKCNSFPRNQKSLTSSRNKLQRCKSVKVKIVDVACDTSDMGKSNDELMSYKRNVELLQQKCITQGSEIDQLRKENKSLKIELRNFYKTNTCLSVSRPIVSVSSNVDSDVVAPKPFESCLETSANDFFLNNTDSEMVITMKKCNHERYKHVSLLQVLHKTNVPISNDDPLLTTSCHKKENPIDLLTKVQNTFGEIVKREIRIVTTKNKSKTYDIDASSCRLNISHSKTAASCSTVWAETSSGSNFASL